MHQGAGERDALLHAARKSVDGIALAGAELGEIEQLVDALFKIGRIVGAAEEADVVAWRKILIERGRLRHVAEIAAHARGVANGIDTEDADRAAGGPRRAGEHADQRGLAGAVGSEQSENFAGFERQRDGSQRVDTAVAFGEAIELDNIHQMTCISGPARSTAAARAGFRDRNWSFRNFRSTNA